MVEVVGVLHLLITGQSAPQRLSLLSRPAGARSASPYSPALMPFLHSKQLLLS